MDKQTGASEKGMPWTEKEFDRILDLYIELRGLRIHKRNSQIISLAEELFRPTRAVEAQLLMFRNLDRGGRYSRQNMSALCREVWKKRGAASLLEALRGADGIISREDGAVGATPRAILALSSRTHGGSDSVALPENNGDLIYEFEAPAPAGVRQILERFVGKASDPTSLEWVFLVGSPGNGKSHQLRVLLDLLTEQGAAPPKNALGRYVDGVALKGRVIRIINDATVRRPLAGSLGVGQLADDLKTAASNRLPVFANVNRGVLIEERAEAEKEESWLPYRELLGWILDGAAGTAAQSVSADPPVQGAAYYRSAEFSEGQTKVRVHVLSLDMVSLLEKEPDGAGGALSPAGDGTLNPLPYRVMAFESEARHDAPASILLQSLIADSAFEGDGCNTCGASVSCPFLANARSLRGQACLGLLMQLRFAELAHGQLLPYRELWSIYSVAILGAGNSFPEGESPCDWVRRKVQTLQKATADIELLELALRRFHHSLYLFALPGKILGIDPAKFGVEPKSDGIGNYLEAIDPARDSEEWSRQVSEAMEAMAYDGTPLAALAGSNLPVRGAIASIDSLLEERILGYCSAANKKQEPERRLHLRWLASSYQRLFAFANLKAGYHRVAYEWIELRRKVDSGIPYAITSSLHKGLSRLILPEMPGVENRMCYVPAFGPRMHPVRVSSAAPVLCYSLPSGLSYEIQIGYEVFGDATWIVIRSSGGKELARAPLDFSMCREALANASGDGFTDLGPISMPRIERIRAALVTMDARPPRLAVVGKSINEL